MSYGDDGCDILFGGFAGVHIVYERLIYLEQIGGKLVKIAE
jgi:hypothetical protein